jgi:hypothetical protein
VPRPVVFYGAEELSGWPVKVYGMTATAPEARPELLNAAREKASEVLAGTSREEDAGAAFLIAHDARPACFVLVHWWQGVDLFQRYFRAPLERPAGLEPVKSGQIGCVWELELVAFEREAWVRHAFGATEPDVAAYLVDRFRD